MTTFSKCINFGKNEPPKLWPKIRWAYIKKFLILIKAFLIGIPAFPDEYSNLFCRFICYYIELGDFTALSQVFYLHVSSNATYSCESFEVPSKTQIDLRMRETWNKKGYFILTKIQKYSCHQQGIGSILQGPRSDQKAGMGCKIG